MPNWRLCEYVDDYEDLVALSSCCQSLRPFFSYQLYIKADSWSCRLLKYMIRLSNGLPASIGPNPCPLVSFEIEQTFHGHKNSAVHIAFLKDLGAAFSNKPHLEHLKVHGIRLTLLVERIFDLGLRDEGKARLLELDAGTKESRKAATIPKSLFHNLSSLVTLKLSGRFEIVPRVAAALKEGYLPQVQCFDLSWCWMESKDFRGLYQALVYRSEQQKKGSSGNSSSGGSSSSSSSCGNGNGKTELAVETQKKEEQKGEKDGAQSEAPTATTRLLKALNLTANSIDDACVDLFTDPNFLCQFGVLKVEQNRFSVQGKRNVRKVVAELAYLGKATVAI
jgi:hypothetical protein